jgi:hypothetical protein
MPTYARRQIVIEHQVGVYHCIARCVRRTLLCGVGPYSGQDYSHRKEWILDRLRELAGLFAIEGNQACIPECRERCLLAAKISITSRAYRYPGCGRLLPAFRQSRPNLWRRRPSRGPAASACEGVRPRVPADPSRALCHAARLDGAGTSRGQARGDSRSPGPNRGQAGDQSIELGGNGTRPRPTLQAGGRATDLTCRCRGATLAALVPR